MQASRPRSFVAWGVKSIQERSVGAPDSYETGWLQEMWKSGTRLCKQRNCGETGEFEPFSWLIPSPSLGFATT